jgi:hypothetical protein
LIKLEFKESGYTIYKHVTKLTGLSKSSRDDSYKELYKKRAECEKMHGYIKDPVKFEVRGVKKGVLNSTHS